VLIRDSCACFLAVQAIPAYIRSGVRPHLPHYIRNTEQSHIFDNLVDERSYDVEKQKQSHQQDKAADPQQQQSSALFHDIAQQIAVLVVRSHRRRQAQAGKNQGGNALHYDDGKP